jgi:predicted kinase
MQTLILVRGIPGAGKTTFVSEFLSDAIIVEADMFFSDASGYHYDPALIASAHTWCQDTVRYTLSQTDRDVIVSNTSTTEKEVKVYKDMADELGVRFISLIVENRHGNESVHNVPQEAVEKMRNRFSVKL